MQKCSLCGGKVVNGRCEDCGLPIPPENRYVLRGETVHTHEVNGEKILHRVRQRADQKAATPRPAARRSQEQTTRRPDGGRRMGLDPRRGSAAGKPIRSQLIWIVVAVVIIVNLVSSCSA